MTLVAVQDEPDVVTDRCIVCETELAKVEMRTCTTCVSETRSHLHSIAVCYEMLPGLLGRPDGATMGAVMGGHSDSAALPAGDILVMMGPGSSHTSAEGDVNDPPAVAYELSNWCEDWAKVRGEAAWPRGVENCVYWLNARLGWAMAHHPISEQFCADIERMCTRLEAVTGMSTAPEMGPACPHCRTRVQRGWTKRGRDDNWTCTECQRIYTPSELRLEILSVLADVSEQKSAKG